MNSFELLKALKEYSFSGFERDELWWPNSGSFDVIVGVMLTQQTKWENVEKALKNLQDAGLMGLDALAAADEAKIATLIEPSGFYNQKAKRLKALCAAIVESFGDFESFCEGVDREWLLTQKGVGLESADSILLYACARETFVVDSYTARLLAATQGMEGLEYDEMREWFENGVQENYDKICKLYDEPDMPLVKIYARYHGKIVEFCKAYCKKGTTSPEILKLKEILL